MRKIRAYLMEMWEEQWQEEVIPRTSILASFREMPRQNILSGSD